MKFRLFIPLMKNHHTGNNLRTQNLSRILGRSRIECIRFRIIRKCHDIIFEKAGLEHNVGLGQGRVKGLYDELLAEGFAVLNFSPTKFPIIELSEVNKQFFF